MAILKPSAITDDELAALRRAARDGHVEPEARCGLLFALGEALEARNADEEAFAAFAEKRKGVYTGT